MNTVNILTFISTITFALIFDFSKHNDEKEISIGESIRWVIFYILLSILFSLFIAFRMGADASILFLTGWGLEKLLAVDNLIVFSAIFAYFGVKDKYQHRILYLGIIGAIVLRLLFVAIGTSVYQSFSTVSDIIFAFIILYSACLMYSSDDKEVDYKNAWYIRYTKKWLPVTDKTNGSRLFINGKATKFLFALISIEISDIVFAFDSVPAVISVTKEPLLIYSSIMFAILGLRSMYFVLLALSRSLAYFESAVIVVLVFIAIKLLLESFTGFHITPIQNLSIVASILTIGAVISKIKEHCYE